MSSSIIKQIERNLPNFQYDKYASRNVFYKFARGVEGANADELCSKVLFDPKDGFVHSDANYVFWLEKSEKKLFMYYYADTQPDRRCSKRIRQNRMLQTPKKFINKRN